MDDPTFPTDNEQLPKCSVCNFHENHDAESFLLVTYCRVHKRNECNFCDCLEDLE